MSRFAARHLAILTSLYLLAGCASWRPQLLTGAPVADVRKERHAAAVRAFEEQRDRAQLAAALDRWQQGDVAGCESRIRTILSRRPDDVEAHVLLAELAWSFDNAAEAETEYRAALKHAPERPDIHHALALVLESVGRGQEASDHLAKATQLESAAPIVPATGSGGSRVQPEKPARPSRPA